jgi:heterotetrameric sarcosine oxidase gamma subunit
MLEMRSVLGDTKPVSHHGMTMMEAAGFTLTQVAGEEKALKKALGKLPAAVGKMLELDDRQLFRIGPKQFWVVGPQPVASEGVFVTPLSSSRARFLLQGAGARRVLAACALIDFEPSEFKPGQFVLTGIHHTPVMIHCVGANSFHIYAMRTFAESVWEWLDDVMKGVISQ